MRHDRTAKSSFDIDRNLLSILCCFLVITAIWLGVYVDNNLSSLTESVKKRSAVGWNGTIASQPTVMNELKNQVKGDLLNEKSKSVVDDPGFVSSALGKAGSCMGQVECSFDNPAKQVEVKSDAVYGQKKENIAKIQDKAVNSGHGAANTVEDVMSNIRSKTN